MKKSLFILVLVLMLALAGCSEAAAPKESTAAAGPVVLRMQELYESMTALNNMPEMLLLDPDMQLNFCGIDAADCLQSVVAICADSLRADEIWLIEAADDAALEKIQNLAQVRLTAKAEEAEGYSPEQYAVIQKAQQMTDGNYFILLVSPDADALMKLVPNAGGN